MAVTLPTMRTLLFANWPSCSARTRGCTCGAVVAMLGTGFKCTDLSTMAVRNALPFKMACSAHAVVEPNFHLTSFHDELIFRIAWFMDRWSVLCAMECDHFLKQALGSNAVWVPLLRRDFGMRRPPRGMPARKAYAFKYTTSKWQGMALDATLDLPGGQENAPVDDSVAQLSRRVAGVHVTDNPEALRTALANLDLNTFDTPSVKPLSGHQQEQEQAILAISPEQRARLARDLYEVVRNSATTLITAFPTVEDFGTWNATFEGRASSLDQGVVFKVRLEFRSTGPSVEEVGLHSACIISPCVSHANVTKEGSVDLKALMKRISLTEGVFGILRELQRLMDTPVLSVCPTNKAAALKWLHVWGRLSALAEAPPAGTAILPSLAVEKYATPSKPVAQAPSMELLATPEDSAHMR